MPAALVRRSISTSYYGLFHFLLNEATTSIVGGTSGLLKRRRAAARAFTHAGMRQALDRGQRPQAYASLQTFLGTDVCPPFARRMAQTFSRAQEQRHDADYDLNAALSEIDALTLARDVEVAIEEWLHAATSPHRDFTNALYLLMLLKGDLRGR